MFERFLDRFADIVTNRRRMVIASLLGVVIFCALQLPRLETDSSPENLIISFGGYEQSVRDFRSYFGDTDSVVALLVVADDVRSQNALQYIHDLSRLFREHPYVVRVESLTVTPLPGASPPNSDATLEDLDSVDDDLNLDDLDVATDIAPSTIDPRVEAALETLVRDDAEHFPMGLYSIAERVGDGSQDLHGVVRGERVTAEEATTIANAIDDAPLARGRLISEDRHVASVVLFLDSDLGTGSRRLEAVHEMNELLAAHPPPEGISVHKAGIPHLRATISDAMIADQTFLVPLSLLVCALLLYASFRWIAGVILPIAMVGMTVTVVLGFMALFGEPLTILMNTLPTLLIIMGISEAVHVIGRYVEETRRTSDRSLAARRAIRLLMIACFLTSFTTAIGFGSLAVAQTEMLQRFGIVAALGVMVTYLILITFIPAAVTYFVPPAKLSRSRGPQKGWLEAFLVASTAKIARKPGIVLALTLLAIGPCLWAYASIRVDTTLLDTFDPSDPIVVSTRLVERHLDGIRPLEIHVSTGGQTDVRDPALLAALDRIATWAMQQEGVLRTTTPSDFLWETWRRLAGIGVDQDRMPFRSREHVDALVTLLDRIEPNPAMSYMTRDGQHARIEIRLADIGAQRSISLIHAIEEKAREELASFDGVEVGFLGEAYIGSHGITAVVDDMFGSLSLSAFVIFLTIGLLFRSGRLGFLAIPPNVIPQVGTVAWMVLRGIPLNASTAIVFSVAIGVSVDLTIHGFARLVEEERRGMRRRAAVVRAARSTGRAIVVSCATLVLGFSVLLLSGFVPVRQFGELIAVALTLSLLATLVFQPAMLMVFGGPSFRSKSLPKSITD
jgi:hydrophobe/amphiphile efflux-3 (HAE3) family protein